MYANLCYTMFSMLNNSIFFFAANFSWLASWGGVVIYDDVTCMYYLHAQFEHALALLHHREIKLRIILLTFKT